MAPGIFPVETCFANDAHDRADSHTFASKAGRSMQLIEYRRKHYMQGPLAV